MQNELIALVPADTALAQQAADYYKRNREFTGRGFMTMAVEMMVRYAFYELHLHRVEANVMPRNAASLRVLEKNAFVNEGLSKYYLNINGIWEDPIHMVKINDAMHQSGGAYVYPANKQIYQSDFAPQTGRHRHHAG